MRTIEIEGQGKVKQSPDCIEISLTIETENKDYLETMRQSNFKTEILKNDLSAIGFDKDDLKTTNFFVDSRYDNVRTDKGENERVFRGYHATHNLILRFAFDSAKLSQVIACLSQSQAMPEFSIQFTVKDQNAYANKLLSSAVLDATNKAQILANASNVKLLNIQNISHTSSPIRPYSPTQFRTRMFMDSVSAPSPMNITPDDIESTNNVKIIWEIM